MTLQELEQLIQHATSEAAAASTPANLEAVRIAYLGRNGRINDVLAALKAAPVEQKKDYGRLANQFKQHVAEAIEARKKSLADSEQSRKAAAFDYTLPGAWPATGRLHPITSLIHKATHIFRSMGFTVAEGPDVEDEFHNFDALNTPSDHPSRDAQDTFYLPGGWLLRTHTSPVQIRYMENHQPPVRIIAPGRCYRRDTTDATHSASFHQIEGLYVNHRVSLAELKGDLEYFVRKLMGRDDIQIRMRPHFFPFTEPSVEVDYSCHVCGGKGCRVCKHSGWIEIGGAGMVNPKVLRACGYDPDHLTGYAFGMGVERMAMILYGIPDIRLLYENDLRFLSQF
ncbi:MAG TPA: phenylalanine--tRNA ligase subunit alpha [Kiritimatiellia bacterium]|nr:phenylalanine--tRNA ligase subunit alpha [Kiritimatiellia bacterium]